MGGILAQTSIVFNKAANLESYPYLETLLACVRSCKEKKGRSEFKVLSL